MKRIIFLIMVLAAFGAQAMGERPEVDPECFASDTLRVEIGGEKYEFPRNMVRSMRGEDVVDVRYTDNSNVSGGDTACQKLEDGFWKLDMVDLDIYPLPCSDDMDCFPTWIVATVNDPSVVSEESYRKQIPDTQKALLEKCTPLRSDGVLNRYQLKNGRICKYLVNTGENFVYFRFFGGIYPPENIDQTVQLVLNEIQKCAIKN